MLAPLLERKRENTGRGSVGENHGLGGRVGCDRIFWARRLVDIWLAVRNSARKKLTFILHLLCLRFYAKHLQKSLLEVDGIFIDEEIAQKMPDIIWTFTFITKHFSLLSFSSGSLEQEANQGWEEKVCEPWRLLPVALFLIPHPGTHYISLYLEERVTSRYSLPGRFPLLPEECWESSISNLLSQILIFLSF